MRGRGEDLTQQAGQFAPLGIGAAAADGQRLAFQTFQGFDLDAQFGDGTGGGGLVEDFFLGGFDFVVGRFVQVFNVFAVEGRQDAARIGAAWPPRWRTSSSRSRLSSRSRRRRRDW
jgi:hypothetical protein